MHPQFNKKQIDQLRSLCTVSEQEGKLAPSLLRIIYRNKWFKLFIPKEQGGLAMNLPAALKLEEQLAYIDGSLGWTVTLCAGANFFAGFMDQEKTGKLFYAKNVCLGGSGAPTGVAKQTKDGYTVTGRWKYATGAPHLTHFTANCIIEKNGKTVVQEDGTPLVRSFYFKKNEVTIYNDWHTMGLVATASRSFSVKNLKVKQERSFVIDHAHTTLKHPVYSYPFMPFAEATLAVNTLGMMNHLLDETAAVVKQKNLNSLQYKIVGKVLQTAQQQINKQSTAFYNSIEQSWKELLTHKTIAAKTIQRISKQSRQLVKLCRAHAALVYPYCGLAATTQQSEINRVFRDLFTASQHALLTYEK